MQIVPVILAGGQGTRLWPLSRSARPKQFLALTGALSPFQETLKRVRDANLYAPAMVITSADYRFLIREQAEAIGVELGAIALEPVARNTAPAIVAAALLARSRFGSQAVIHVLPSDHSVETDDSYWQSIETGARAAAAGDLVTFGITPTGPDTGLGYIEAGGIAGEGARNVIRFVEKPSLAAAQEMLAKGGFFWNSGMFMLSVSSFLDECEALAFMPVALPPPPRVSVALGQLWDGRQRVEIGRSVWRPIGKFSRALPKAGSRSD